MPRKRLPVVAVDDAGEGRHLLVALAAEAAGHRVQRRVDLVDAHRARAGLGDHRGGQRGQAFLARRIVGRADAEEQLDVELRQHRLLLHERTPCRPRCGQARPGGRPAAAARPARLTTRAPARVAIAGGSGSFDSVVTTRPASVKYFRAAAWRSAGRQRVVACGSSC